MPFLLTSLTYSRITGTAMQASAVNVADEVKILSASLEVGAIVGGQCPFDNDGICHIQFIFGLLIFTRSSRAFI